MCLSDCEQDVMDAEWEEGIYGMRIDIEWERDEGGTKAKGLHVVGGSRLIYPVTNFSGPFLTLASSNSAFIILGRKLCFLFTGISLFLPLFFDGYFLFLSRLIDPI